MASEKDKGARPKRGIASVDYKKLHEGAGLDDVTPGRNGFTMGKLISPRLSYAYQRVRNVCVMYMLSTLSTHYMHLNRKMLPI